jgi:hypothetical protein
MSISAPQVPTTFRADPEFSGLLFGEQPWFGSITRVTYVDGTPTEVAYLALSGWAAQPLTDLTSDLQPSVYEAYPISRESVIKAFSESLDAQYCDVNALTPESPARVLTR